MELPIAEYPSIVKKYLPLFEKILTKPQLEHFAQYLSGLILCHNHTVQGINDAFVDHGDRSCLSRYLTESPWEEGLVDRVRLGLIKEKVKGASIKNSCLVIDDTLNRKTGEKIEGIDYYRDPATGEIVLGHPLVTSHLVTPNKEFPIGFRLYRKFAHAQKDPTVKFKTKIELAQELVLDACGLDLPFSTVVFDSWYFCKEFTEFIEKRGKDWVGGCKANRKIIMPGGKGIKISEWLKSLSSDVFKYCEIDGKEYWVFTKSFHMIGQGWVRLVVVYDNRELKDEPLLVVTNRLDWEMRRIIRIYHKRPRIDAYYRFAKQNLGLEDYELRRLEGILRHWGLVFLAATLLQLSSLDSRFDKWINSNLRTVGVECRRAFVEAIRNFILLILQLARRVRDADEILTLIFCANEKLRIRPMRA